MISRNDPCFCGSGKKWKNCHYPKLSPQDEKQALADKYFKTYRIRLKEGKDLEEIRKACTLTANILKKACAFAKAGVTTNQIDGYVAELTKTAGAIAAPLGYGNPPYPKHICTSLNEVICHGIPDDVPLKEGDLLNIDVSCILNGYYGDCSAMVKIGEVSSERKRVYDVSKECLEKSIKILKPGVPLYMIAETICDHAESKGCSVVYQFVGHGIGIEFHEAPQVSHHRNNNQTLIVPGMTFTIEPMINAGVAEGIVDSRNGWTTRTRDGKASAQWEHTVLITENGYEILTLPTE